MKVYGEEIKKARKLKNLTQLELSQGICTQATISNIEKHNVCDSLEIFSAVCVRLELDINQCVIETDEQVVVSLLDKVESLCNLLNYKEAYKLIKDVNYQLSEKDLVYVRFNYYKGITILLGGNEKKECLHYLHLVQIPQKEIKSKGNVYHVLSTNALGVYYQLNNEMNKAKVYYDKSVKMLDKLTLTQSEYPRDFYKVFYNSAIFYSEIKEYRKSISLCLQGIYLNQQNNSTHFMEFLYYELGYNKYQIGEEATEAYQFAFLFAKYHQNKAALDVIIHDMKEFNLSFGLFSQSL